MKIYSPRRVAQTTLDCFAAYCYQFINIALGARTRFEEQRQQCRAKDMKREPGFNSCTQSPQEGKENNTGGPGACITKVFEMIEI